jgi:hypothetical protein
MLCAFGKAIIAPIISGADQRYRVSYNLKGTGSKGQSLAPRCSFETMMTKHKVQKNRVQNKHKLVNKNRARDPISLFPIYYLHTTNMSYKMQQADISAQEQRLAVERERKYVGTARAQIKALHLPPRKPRDTVLQKLRGSFHQEGGYRPLDVQNHVPATISQGQLNVALRLSDISTDGLLNPPDGEYPVLKLPDNIHLEYLHGLHRIQAAKDVLP